jgi:hypothetical protein
VSRASSHSSTVSDSSLRSTMMRSEEATPSRLLGSAREDREGRGGGGERVGDEGKGRERRGEGGREGGRGEGREVGELDAEY